jgi:CelD/BcsL family acetyltransferase involved in cellulose biosynthesis
VPLPRREELEPEWRSLESRSRECSFFTSWCWIGAWLAKLPGGLDPRLVRVESGDRVVGLGVLVPRAVRRRGVLRSSALFLNCTGDPELDELSIEYNGLLAETGLEREVTQQALESLLAQEGWDEWFLEGLAQPATLDITPPPGVRFVSGRRHPCWYVDLEELRASGRDFIETLDSNTRYALRRNIRHYQKRGRLHMTGAVSPDEAAAFLAELKRLHQAAWQRRGRPGSFSNRFFDDFHADLVRSRFAEGVIQLLRLRLDDHDVGYLYNFVHRGHVYNYQSGFNFDVFGKLSPGLVCHAYAVELNKAQGERAYDFMAGDDRFKRQLGKSRTEMAWVCIQRDRYKFRVENWLRAVRGSRGAASGT